MMTWHVGQNRPADHPLNTEITEVGCDMNNGDAGEFLPIALMVGYSLISLGIVVWYLVAVNALFPRIGLAKNQGWIPIWNEAMIIQRGGMSPWLMLLILIPGGGLVVLVIKLIAINRIHREYGKGGGLTLLALVLPPLWATVLGGQLKNAPAVSWTPGQGAQSPFAQSGPGAAAADSQPWTAAPAVPLNLPLVQDSAPATVNSTATATPSAQNSWGFGPETEHAYHQLSTQELQPLTVPLHEEHAVEPFTWPGHQAIPSPASVASPSVAPTHDWAPPTQTATSSPEPEGLTDILFQSPQDSVRVAPRVAAPQPPTPAASPSEGDGLDDDVERTIFVQRKASEYWALELADGSLLKLPSNDVIVGRRPTATGGASTLIIADSTRTLSKSHVHLHVIDGAWMVSDLDSTNGLIVIDESGAETSVVPGQPEPATEEMMFGTLRVKLRLVSTEG
jgi:hypothetical protein